MGLVNQFEIYLVSLNPTRGAEIQKTRPALIISPDELNHSLKTCLIAPLTSTLKEYPSRVRTKFDKRNGDIALDQIRAVDKQRLIKKLGKADRSTSEEVLKRLREMFA